MKNVPCASAIGILMYIMICTRPDIAHAVGVVNQFMSNPGRQHWEIVKWILRYLKGTVNKVLCFGSKDLTSSGFVDVDLGGNDLDKRKSMTGYVFTYGGIAIS